MSCSSVSDAISFDTLPHDLCSSVFIVTTLISQSWYLAIILHQWFPFISMTHIFIHSILWTRLCLSRRYGPLALPAIFILQKRSGILSYCSYLSFVLLFIFFNIFVNFLFVGLRGKAPMISLGGNSLYMNGSYSSWRWMIGCIEIAENSSILRWFDRSW